MPVLTNVKVLWEDFVSLIYPDVCVHCSEVLVKNESYLCLKCRSELPVTNYHEQNENPVYNRFAYLNKLVFATSYLHFHRQGIAQSVLHELKYKGGYKLGIELGRWFGGQLAHLDLDLDYLIPVPIHQSKMKLRGYNQSMAISEGLAERMKVPVRDDLVIRNKRTSTQTRKSRVERWENIQDVFALTQPGSLTDKKIMLVDDVITTGATLASLAEMISRSEISEISLVSVATGIK